MAGFLKILPFYFSLGMILAAFQYIQVYFSSFTFLYTFSYYFFRSVTIKINYI